MDPFKKNDTKEIQEGLNVELEELKVGLSDEQIILNKKIKKILYQYPKIEDFCKGMLSWDNDERFKQYNVE